MRLPQYPEFQRDRVRFDLRFTCEHCALFDPPSGSCAHGFPTAEHRLEYYECSDVPLVFCKDFELT
jgi:hypothetical protein